MDVLKERRREHFWDGRNSCLPRAFLLGVCRVPGAVAPRWSLGTRRGEHARQTGVWNTGVPKQEFGNEGRGARGDVPPAETTAVLPAATANPARAPPDLRRDRSIDSRVVLPAFHWLVSNVKLARAMKPCHSHWVGAAVLGGTSWSQISSGSVGSVMGRLQFHVGRWHTHQIPLHPVGPRCWKVSRWKKRGKERMVKSGQEWQRVTTLRRNLRHLLSSVGIHCHLLAVSCHGGVAGG